MRFLSVNLDAVLVELDDLPQTLSLAASLRGEPIHGVVEIVPAARTVLVRFRPSAVGVDALVRDIGRRPVDRPVPRVDTRIEIPVRYDGEDLAEVAALLGITTSEVVHRHTGTDYTVAFTGFAPGFAYLAGGDRGLDVPRRRVPRTRIPAGAVAIAGNFSGVYPQASPGGWQILGVTDTPMWDLARASPALLQPGDRVRFVDVTGRTDLRAEPGASIGGPASSRPVAMVRPAGDAALRIRSAGLQAVFQDLGRGGQAAQGVSASGAMDRRSLQSANRLVGNDSGAPCIEIAQGGFELVAEGDSVIAVTGADAELTLRPVAGTARAVPRHQALALADGDTLHFGEPHAGVRSYLAVRGGFVTPPVLGSASTDTLARVGPPALAAGDVLPVGRTRIGGIVAEPDLPPDDLPTTAEPVVLDIVLGPRTDWFTPEAVDLLCAQHWQVTPQSNRVGLRLAGAVALTRSRDGELPSEGTLRGSIQVPPSGQPVLFMADHPLTGGYPVIASVAVHHLDRAGQVPVGARLRFRKVDMPPLPESLADEESPDCQPR